MQPVAKDGWRSRLGIDVSQFIVLFTYIVRTANDFQNLFAESARVSFQLGHVVDMADTHRFRVQPFTEKSVILIFENQGCQPSGVVKDLVAISGFLEHNNVIIREGFRLVGNIERRQVTLGECGRADHRNRSNGTGSKQEGTSDD